VIVTIVTVGSSRDLLICKPFPDLKLGILKEIVSTGNTVTVQDIPQLGGKHLTPSEFHNALEDDGEKETVVIDVRNTFEYNIGHFVPPSREKNKVTEVMNPEMVTFSAFNGFCDKNVDFLKDKRVLMYCTGGIRCEKASAMLQKRGVPDVSQLHGGIHRYIEQYGESGYFCGKNFVFDQRVAIDASDNNQIVVGKCINCKDQFDELSGSRICSVCRDLVLVCPNCQNSLREYHCKLHSTWKEFYFTFLEVFDSTELKYQIDGLETVLVKVTSKNIKRTLRKQITKVQERINALQNGTAQVDRNATRRCRTCREPDEVCDGLCWGFWKNNEGSTEDHGHNRERIQIGDCVKPGPNWNEVRLGNPDRYKKGRIIQVKSWAGGQQGNCAVVLWDTNISKNGIQSKEESERQSPQIYRFGVLSKDSVPKYDVVKL
jgi:predicted sulfurtransferase